MSGELNEDELEALRSAGVPSFFPGKKQLHWWLCGPARIRCSVARLHDALSRREVGLSRVASRREQYHFDRKAINAIVRILTGATSAVSWLRSRQIAVEAGIDEGIACVAGGTGFGGANGPFHLYVAVGQGEGWAFNGTGFREMPLVTPDGDMMVDIVYAGMNAYSPARQWTFEWFPRKARILKFCKPTPTRDPVEFWTEKAISINKSRPIDGLLAASYIDVMSGEFRWVKLPTTLLGYREPGEVPAVFAVNNTHRSRIAAAANRRYPGCSWTLWHRPVEVRSTSLEPLIPQRKRGFERQRMVIKAAEDLIDES